MNRPLNDIMEFQRIIRIENGEVKDYSGPLYAPEDAYWDNGDPELDQGLWTLETGWTGQYSYSGPCMHPSEYIGGRLADYILETDGLWVAIVIEDIDDLDNPAGWAVAHIPADEVPT